MAVVVFFIVPVFTFVADVVIIMEIVLDSKRDGTETVQMTPLRRSLASSPK